MYKIESQEDQQKFAVPLNRDTEKLFYNQRMIIDANVVSEPRAWRISKVNRISPNGIARITLAQDNYDQHKDYIEINEDGNVIGMWADYYKEGVEPTTPEEPQGGLRSEILISGNKYELKVGGSYKKLTVNTYKDNELQPYVDGTWNFYINDVDVSDLIGIYSGTAIEENQTKIKFIGSDEYIGEKLIIEFNNNQTSSSVELELIGL